GGPVPGIVVRRARTRKAPRRLRRESESSSASNERSAIIATALPVVGRGLVWLGLFVLCRVVFAGLLRGRGRVAGTGSPHGLVDFAPAATCRIVLCRGCRARSGARGTPGRLGFPIVACFLIVAIFCAPSTPLRLIMIGQ